MPPTIWGAADPALAPAFSIGRDLIPREMVDAYAVLKRPRPSPTMPASGSPTQPFKLIVAACDEILSGHHHDMFPLHVWMTGSGTQFNMNVNEIVSNRCCQLAGTPLGSHAPVHPNDHVNIAQSSNDSFPSAMYVATVAQCQAATACPRRSALHDAAIAAKARRLGRTSSRSAAPTCWTPRRYTLGAVMVAAMPGCCADGLVRLEATLQDFLQALARRHRGGYRHQRGSVASTWPRPRRSPSAHRVCPSSPHPASSPCSAATMRCCSSPARLNARWRVSLYKIGNDIRLMSCGPRCRLRLVRRFPANELGSSIMPRQVNPDAGRGADHRRRRR